MKKYSNILIMAVILLLLLFSVIASSGCLRRIKSHPEAVEILETPFPKATTTATATAVGNGIPPDVPLIYADKYKEINTWLDEKLIEWKPDQQKKMSFGAYHVFASDEQFVRTNQEIDLKFLDVLEETNCDIIVLYIRPKSYFSQKERYDTLLNKIRTYNKKIFIGVRFDEEEMSFNEYEKGLTDYTTNIIAEVKPDYYGIVIEPTTSEKRNGFDVSNQEWIDLIKKNSDLTKQLSPETKTAVSGHKDELDFLELASNINNLDIIGFDLYDNGGMYPEYSGYHGKGDLVGDVIDYANSKGKETWMLETWVADFTLSSDYQQIGTQDYIKPLDAKWIQIATYYAMRHDMEVVTPFFTGKFVTYTTKPKEFINSLNNNERTPIFNTFKDLNKKY